jgi:Tfp pilus assembly protein PilE
MKVKKIIVWILIAVAAYFAYQEFVVKGRSDEVRQVQALAEEFQALRQRMGQAERAAAAGGVDTTSDADDAMHAAAKLLEKLKALQEELSEDSAIDMANDLGQKLDAFLARGK